MAEPFVVESVADAEAAFARALRWVRRHQRSCSGWSPSSRGVPCREHAGDDAVGADPEIGLLRRWHDRAPDPWLRPAPGIGLWAGRLLLGLPLGLQGAVLVAVVSSSRTALVTDVSLNPAVIVLALALGLGVTLLAAWGPAAEAARVSARWKPSGQSRSPRGGHGADCAGS